LTGFLKGDFRQKKGHQLGYFGESQLMALEESSGGITPSGTAFFSIVSPRKNQPAFVKTSSGQGERR
jgi:hypothetical protein